MPGAAPKHELWVHVRCTVRGGGEEARQRRDHAGTVRSVLGLVPGRLEGREQMACQGIRSSNISRQVVQHGRGSGKAGCAHVEWPGTEHAP